MAARYAKHTQQITEETLSRSRRRIGVALERLESFSVREFERLESFPKDGRVEIEFFKGSQDEIPMVWIP